MVTGLYMLVILGHPWAGSAELVPGTVVEDHTGSPVGDAVVRAVRVSPQEHIPPAELETDTNGRFRVALASTGEYRIEVSRTNYVTTVLRIRVGFIPAALVVRLVRCASISGRVTDEGGRPIRLGEVLAVAAPTSDRSILRPRSLQMAGLRVRLDEEGRFRLYNVAPGSYMVAVRCGTPAARSSAWSAGMLGSVGPGVLYYPDSRRPRVFPISGGEELRGIDFTVPSHVRYSIRGRVEIPRPGALFSLALVSASQPEVASAAAHSDSDGAFQFAGVAPGSYHLLVAGPVQGESAWGALLDAEPLYGRTSIDVIDRDIEGLSIPVWRGRRASFALRASSGQEAVACPADSEVTLSPAEDWSTILERNLRLRAGEESTVENLAPARYHIRATLNDSCYQEGARTVDLTSENHPKTVMIRIAAGGSISGKLQATERPSDYVVALCALQTTGGHNELWIAVPDPGSGFAFTNIRPGHYRIGVEKASDLSKARWLANTARMFDIDVTGSGLTEVDLPVPPRTSLEDQQHPR